MRRSGMLLVEESQGWRLLAAIEGGPSLWIEGRNSDGIAISTLDFAHQHGLAADKLVIAVATESVLFASVPTHDVRRGSLYFALESQLPIDAEDIVADTITRRGRNAIGNTAAVAMEFHSILPLVDSLEQRQCQVQYIVPLSLLAFEQSLDDHSVTTQPNRNSTVICRSTDGSGRSTVEVLIVDGNGDLLAWQKTAPDAQSIDRCVALLHGDPDSIVELPDRTQLACKRTHRLLSGKSRPCVDLRRNQLAMADPWRHQRSAWIALGIASGVFLATLCGCMIWAALRYQREASSSIEQQVALFEQTYPGQRIPAAILSRFKSEYARSMGARRSHTSTTTPESALAILQPILESLGQEFPFEIEEIRIDSDRLSLDVKFASQNDTGIFAATLASRGFIVEPPSSTLVDGDRIRANFTARATKQAVTPRSSLKGLR